MLNNEIRENPLFLGLEDTVKGLGLELVDVKKTQQGGGTVLVSVTIVSKDKEAGIDECAMVHRAIMPELELQIGRDNLAMEVSTPGLQRNFRDFWEFMVFQGRRCRVYSISRSSWVTGIIEQSEAEIVKLSDYLVEDTSEKGQTIELGYSDIQKAKLEYKWEDVKNVRVK